MLVFVEVFKNLFGSIFDSFIFIFHYDTRYDTRCYFNLRSKADMNRLNLPLGDDN